jgi:diadenosine tetraphosphatase ApaH/serine/threonine PP2A family protein phosphatase
VCNKVLLSWHCFFLHRSGLSRETFFDGGESLWDMGLDRDPATEGQMHGEIWQDQPSLNTDKINNLSTQTRPTTSQPRQDQPPLNLDKTNHFLILNTLNTTKVFQEQTTLLSLALSQLNTSYEWATSHVEEFNQLNLP